MKYFFIIAFALCSCKQSSKYLFHKVLNQPENKNFKKIILFNDSSYLFTLTTIDTTYSNKITAVVNLLHYQNDKIDTLINDSLFCKNRSFEDPELKFDFEDYNFDKTKDIILPAGEDPRSNHGFHLYVIDNKAKTLNHIQDFDQIGNPKVDLKDSLINSFVLSGQSFCKFYVIDRNNKLIDLKHEISFDFDNSDSIRYSKAIVEIYKDRKKNY